MDSIEYSIVVDFEVIGPMLDQKSFCDKLQNDLYNMGGMAGQFEIFAEPERDCEIRFGGSLARAPQRGYRVLFVRDLWDDHEVIKENYPEVEFKTASMRQLREEIDEGLDKTILTYKIVAGPLLENVTVLAFSDDSDEDKDRRRGLYGPEYPGEKF